VTRHRRVLVAFAAAALIWAPAATAKDKPKSEPVDVCKAPGSGFRACLKVRYLTGDDGSASDVRVTARLLRRLDRCPSRRETRTVVIRRDGDERVGTQSRRSTCSKGLMRWTAHFDSKATADWELQTGSTVDALWNGTRAATSVVIGEKKRAGR
jgi:hypothetical protein